MDFLLYFNRKDIWFDLLFCLEIIFYFVLLFSYIIIFLLYLYLFIYFKPCYLLVLLME